MKGDEHKDARPTLDYPSPPPSPYDRPVEQTLRFARQLRIVLGVVMAIGIVIVIAFVVWVVSKLT